MRTFILKFTAALLIASYATFAPIPLAQVGQSPMVAQVHAQQGNYPDFTQILQGAIDNVVQGLSYVQDTLIAAYNEAQTYLAQQLNLKEFKLDFLAWQLAKLTLRSITRSIVNWINSGFQGRPAFVQNFKQFMLGVADEYVDEYIYGSYLDFLCQPFQLDIRIALELQYGKSRENQGLRCTISGIQDNIENFLTGTFEEGGWERWFDISVNQNTPYGVYLNAQSELYAGIRTAQGNSRLEQEVGSGFLSFAICETPETERAANSANGVGISAANKDDCFITKPGQFIADRINSVAGYGEKSLIEADEINEIVGALFEQLAVRAVTSAAGLLGLTASGYQGGTGSYASAFEEEKSDPHLSGTSDSGDITADIARHQAYLDQFDDFNPPVEDKINDVEEELIESREQYPNCFSLSFTRNWPQILEFRDISFAAAITVPSMIRELETLEIAMSQSSLSSEDRIQLLQQYQALQQDSRYVSILDSSQSNALTEVYKIWSNSVAEQIQTEEDRCAAGGEPIFIGDNSNNP